MKRVEAVKPPGMPASEFAQIGRLVDGRFSHEEFFPDVIPTGLVTFKSLPSKDSGNLPFLEVCGNTEGYFKLIPGVLKHFPGLTELHDRFLNHIYQRHINYQRWEQAFYEAPTAQPEQTDAWELAQDYYQARSLFQMIAIGASQELLKLTQEAFETISDQKVRKAREQLGLRFASTLKKLPKPDQYRAVLELNELANDLVQLAHFHISQKLKYMIFAKPTPVWTNLRSVEDPDVLRKQLTMAKSWSGHDSPLEILNKIIQECTRKRQIVITGPYFLTLLELFEMLVHAESTNDAPPYLTSLSSLIIESLVTPELVRPQSLTETEHDYLDQARPLWDLIQEFDDQFVMSLTQPEQDFFTYSWDFLVLMLDSRPDDYEIILGAVAQRLIVLAGLGMIDLGETTTFISDLIDDEDCPSSVNAAAQVLLQSLLSLNNRNQQKWLLTADLINRFGEFSSPPYFQATYFDQPDLLKYIRQGLNKSVINQVLSSTEVFPESESHQPWVAEVQFDTRSGLLHITHHQLSQNLTMPFDQTDLQDNLRHSLSLIVKLDDEELQIEIASLDADQIELETFLMLEQRIVSIIDWFYLQAKSAYQQLEEKHQKQLQLQRTQRGTPGRKADQYQPSSQGKKTKEKKPERTEATPLALRGRLANKLENQIVPQQLSWSGTFGDHLSYFDAGEQKKITEAIRRFNDQNGQHSNGHNVRVYQYLKGPEGATIWRMRVGDYRIFAVRINPQEAKLVYVDRRSKVYLKNNRNFHLMLYSQVEQVLNKH